MYIESFIEIKKREKTNGGNSNISTAFLFQILSNNQSIYNSFLQEMRRKNHTCEEGGPHFKICLAFIDELEKQLFIENSVETGQ